MALIAAIPFLYFLFSEEPYNWLYYTAVLLLMGSTIGMNIVEWRNGERQKVKRRLVMYGIYAIIFMILILFQFYGN